MTAIILGTLGIVIGLILLIICMVASLIITGIEQLDRREDA